MIKGLGYLKYLKLSLIGLGISFFTGFLGNSVNGLGAYTTVGINSSPSAVNGNYDITFLKGGGLLSNYIGQSKGILALDNQILFWRLPDGLPYFYTTLHNIQGYFPKFYYCSSLSSGGSYQEPANCTENIIDENTTTLLKNFFNTVKAGDVVYYNYFNEGGVYWWAGFKICWDSSELGRSMCFDTVYNYNGNQTVVGKQLINSRGYTNLTFASLSYSDIGYAPGQAGYGGGGNIDGDSSIVSPGEITGNVMSTFCTNQTALNWYNMNHYNERMCYSSYGNNTDILVSGEVAPSFAIPGTDINTVWIDTRTYRRYGQTGEAMGYSEWFRYWRKAYEVYKANQDSVSNPFVGVPVSVFTLMGDVDVFGLPFTNESILEYCDLAVYSDTIDLGNLYTGVAQSSVCNQSAIDLLDYAINGESGNNTIGSSWVGITNRDGYTSPPVGSGGNENSSSNINPGGSSGNLNSYQDGKTFQNNFFNSLSSSYKFPSGSGNGILPSYIIIALCCLIYFRFISH